MSSSKPFFASKPRAFMMFQTIGLNTGRVRLETLIFGLICAYAAVAPGAAIAGAMAAAKWRREILSISTSPIGPATPLTPAFPAPGMVTHEDGGRATTLLAIES